MIVLDAYALVALIADEPAAGDVASLLASGEAGVPLIQLAESLDVLQRVYGFTADEAREPIDLLVDRELVVLCPEVPHGWRAAELRARHYRRRTSPVSLADCFLIAAAEPGGRVATADPALARVAGAEGIEVVELPDAA